MDLRRLLARQLDGLAQPSDQAALDRLESHRDLLLSWNPAAKLVSAAAASPSGLARHYQESLQALPVIDGAVRIVDLGSGGGFPGLVWSCLRPDKEIVLGGSVKRKWTEGGEKLAELELRVISEEGKDTTPGAAIVVLDG